MLNRQVVKSESATIKVFKFVVYFLYIYLNLCSLFPI